MPIHQDNVPPVESVADTAQALPGKVRLAGSHVEIIGKVPFLGNVDVAYCLYHGHLQVPGACVGGNVTSGSEVVSLRTRGTEIERRLLGKSAGTECIGE